VTVVVCVHGPSVGPNQAALGVVPTNKENRGRTGRVTQT
jgi:hypothetical protein